jgi:hypothetical protein
MKRLNMAVLSAAALLCATMVRAETKVTVGVGHMCCNGCKTSATAALSKVAGNVNIEGTTLTITMKENNLVPVLDALRKGGFPANRIEAGSAPVTINVGHLCCQGCKNSLTKTLADSKIEGLDTDAIKIGEDSVTLKAKEGKTLDLAPVLAAIEKGGFSAVKITLGAASASLPAKPRVAAR